MRLFFCLLILISLVHCTPKTSTPIVEEPLIEEVQEEPLGPCVTLDQLSPSEKDATETAYVLYKDLVKQKKYDEALPLWEKAFYTAPAATGNIRYQYDDGVAIYKHLYATTKDETEKLRFKDSIISIYDKRIECLGESAYVAGRKGFDLYYYLNPHSSEDEIFALFKEHIDGKGEGMEYFVINPFAKILYDKAVQGNIAKEEAGNYAMQVLSAVKKGKENCTKDCEAWQIVGDYAPPRLENLEGIKGLYPCSYFISKYYQEYLDNSDDCDVINTVLRKLRFAECDESMAEVQEILQVKKSKCYVAPPQESTLRQAYNAYEAGDFTTAVQKFEEYANSKDDIEKKAKYLLLIAKIYYGEIRNFPKARSYAEKAASIKGNWGEPYLLIGKLYASSGPLCGPGTGWDSQIVTWPAIDMFKKAKSIDPSAGAEADKWIATYAQYMPSKADIFQRNIQEGASFKVGCWINRNTTVRTAK